VRGIVEARNHSVIDGRGGVTHPAWSHWSRLLTLAFRLPVKRVLDPTAPLEAKLQEVDLVEVYAWWLVVHQGVTVETAKTYYSVVNAVHERQFGIGLAGGFPLTRVGNMLDGLTRLRGAPKPRRIRYGVRPSEMHTACSRLDHSAAHQNYRALFQTATAGVVRGCELASNLRGGAFDPVRHPSRADVDFVFERGELAEVTVWAVNSKCRGADRNRKLPIRLAVDGRYLSPGRCLYRLCREIDPVPEHLERSTPLFRRPDTNQIITVDQMRRMLRSLMDACGRDGSKYGAHSCRIGGATALAFLHADSTTIKTLGRWKSDAYLMYVRDCKGAHRAWAQSVCDALVDTYEADCLEVDAEEDDSDYD
jgi:hypothetical protein